VSLQYPHSEGGQAAIAPVVRDSSTLFVGQSAAIERLKSVATRVAARASTVMISGETGTGKEMLARFIHSQSPRAGKPFIPVDCTAFSEALFESQLFGHVKGAFTGAHRDALGFIRAADGGTLFLDEIGELGPSLQAKLLRVLQERRVVPVGDVWPRPVDIRVICATNRDLGAMVNEGAFRQDLYFRLQVFSIHVPPLRERLDDVIPLSEHCLRCLAELGEHHQAHHLSDPAGDALLRHNWPGNVRELFNVLEHAHVLAESEEIQIGDLPAPLSTGGFRARQPSEFNLASIERRAIIEALKRCNYNRTAACKLLGLELRKLNRRLTSLKIELPAKRPAPPQPPAETPQDESSNVAAAS
jgi:transcriptional regulator with PAS, ATPase and Fis domain